MFLPQDPLESGLYPDGSLEQYAGSIVFPAKPRTNPAESARSPETGGTRYQY
jgi:hypothetical protein